MPKKGVQNNRASSNDIITYWELNLKSEISGNKLALYVGNYMILLSFLFFFFLVGGKTMAYGSSQASITTELQLLAHATATETPDPSFVCNLYCCSQQCQIFQHTEWGQGSNWHPHGYKSGSLQLSHSRNSYIKPSFTATFSSIYIIPSLPSQSLNAEAPKPSLHIIVIQETTIWPQCLWLSLLIEKRSFVWPNLYICLY